MGAASQVMGTDGAIETIFNKNKTFTLKDKETKNSYVITEGAAASTIVTTNTDGTFDHAIKLKSTAGGIALTGVAASQVMKTDGNITLTSSGGNKSVKITTTNTKGTIDDAITLKSTAGGIALTGVA